MIKKNPLYLNYFKSQTQQLQNFPEPEDNVDNYRKILKNVLNFIGVASEKVDINNDNNAISFIDPGYNDPKEESQLRGFLSNNEKTKKPVGPGTKKFISPSDTKKVVPGKKEDIFDIFSDEKQTSQSKANSGFENLLFTNQAKADTDLLLWLLLLWIIDMNRKNERVSKRSWDHEEMTKIFLERAATKPMSGEMPAIRSM